MSGRILVVGDVMNDIVAVPRHPLRPNTDTDARIEPRPGGSAANTAAWLGALGATVDFVGAVGALDAEYHTNLLRNADVSPHLQVEPGMPTGSIVVIVEGESRTMLSDRGANAALRADAVPAWLWDDVAHLHISGYSIAGDSGAGAPGRLIREARTRRIEVSVTPGSVGYLADYGAERFLGDIAGVDLVFPNLDEGRLLSGETDPQRIGARLLAFHPMVVLTLGSAGIILFRRDHDPVPVPAARADTFVDPTGAGDALAAGFLVRWVADHDAEAAARAAVVDAARAVTFVGGRPPV